MMAAPRARLERAWARLAAQGAVIRRPQLGRLTPTELGALVEHEETRLRALTEGRAAGWHPKAPR